MSDVKRLLRIYLASKTGSPWHYVAGETLQALLGWIPSLVGIGIRGIAYQLFLRAESIPAIEDHVRLSRTEDITLGRSVFIDYGCYLHGGPGELRIGSHSWIMDDSTVLDYPDLPAERLEYWQKRAFREWAMRPAPIATYLKMLVSDTRTFKSAINVGLQHLGWVRASS